MIDILYGRHPILEALKSNRRSINKLEIAKGIKVSGVVLEILSLAEEKQVPIVTQPRNALDNQKEHNQGIIAFSSPYQYFQFDQVLERITGKTQPVIILLLDVIQNPQNLGTLLRTAEAVGVDGVILPLRRGVGVTPAVVRTSAGASEHLMITQYNLAQAIKTLKERNIWIYGLENSEKATLMSQVDLPPRVGLVVGGEGTGLRRLIRETCDQLLRIPSRGEIDSLNAAVAGSIALYFIWQARGFN